MLVLGLVFFWNLHLHLLKWKKRRNLLFATMPSSSSFSECQCNPPEFLFLCKLMGILNSICTWDMALLKIIFLLWWLQHPSFCSTLYFLFFSFFFLMHWTSCTPHEQQLGSYLYVPFIWLTSTLHFIIFGLEKGKRKNEVWCWESWRVHSNWLDPVVTVFFWLVMHMAQATSFAPCYVSGVDWVSLVLGCLGECLTKCLKLL